VLKFRRFGNSRIEDKDRSARVYAIYAKLQWPIRACRPYSNSNCILICSKILHLPIQLALLRNFVFVHKLNSFCRL